MKPEQIINQLEMNRLVFKALLSDREKPLIGWKPNPKEWSLLEITCHLYDEEREDFRQRVFITLLSPGMSPPPIDPPGWVLKRKYARQEYSVKVDAFLAERKSSIKKLRALKQP